MTDVRRVVLGVCVIALACGPVSMLAQSQPSETRAVRRQLTGKVVDVDGRAVSQARVMVGNWERLRRVTVEGNTLAGDPVRIETTRDGRFAIDTTGLSTRGVVVAIAPSGAWAVVDPVLTGDVNLVVTVGSAVKLEGRVTDSKRQPVAGATVRLAAHVGGAWLSRAVVTGGDGVYRMGGLPYDPNQLEYDGAAVVVTAPGFAMQRWSLAWSDEKVGKGGGDRTWTLDVPLSRGGGLTGTVRDQSGEAIAGARVVAWGSTHDIHLSEIDLTATCPDRVIVGSATTTAEGTYEIRNVPLLRQLGWISGEHDWTGTLRSGAQKRFHGGLVVVAKGYDPAMIELPRASREGGVLTQPIVLRPSTRVLGRVVDASGAGVSGLRVVARFEHGDRMVDQLLFDRGPGDRICEQVTGSAGDFAFDGLPESTVPGRLELWAMDKAGVAQGASAEVVKPGSETTVKDIVLDGRATQRSLTGIVETETGRCVPGVEVRLQERPERGGYEYANVSDVDGRFPVLEGTESWSLRASAPGFAPTTLRDPMTTIGADGNLHVKLGAPVPRGGTVVDAAGRPVEAARIAFMPKSKEDGYAWTVSDAKGRFRFDDLPADAVGSVDVAPPLPVGSPSEANRTQTDYAFKTEPRPLELLSKHATYKLDWLPVPPGITLNVKVLDEKDGALVPGPIRAMLFANARSARKPERRVDPSGEPHTEVFTLHQSDPGVVRARGIPAGDHSLSIDAPGFALPKRLAITVAESPAAQEVVVRMARGMVLAGKVIVSGNRPGRGLLLVSAVSSEITSQTFECSPEADGSFRLPVPWFGYTVQAFVRDPDGNHLMQSLIVELAEGAAECGKLTLEVKPAIVLRLRIAKELREAGTCVLVRVVDGAERVWFERSSLDANPYVEGGKEGELVANVPEGRYVVQLLAGYGRDREVVKTMNVIAPAIVQITPP